MGGSLLEDGEHVAGVEDQDVLTVGGDLGAAVLAVDDGVADLDVDGDDLAALLAATAGTDGEDLALLGLFLGGVGDHQTAGGGFLGLARTNDDPVFQGLKLHVRRLRWRGI
jgi:hypothetical protein